VVKRSWEDSLLLRVKKLHMYRRFTVESQREGDFG
jgi:hypothetical protein